MFRWSQWKKIVRKRARTKSVAKTYNAHKETARALILARLAHYSSQHTFIWNRVAIRNTRRTWGSCSSKKNLNFNYKLLFLPPCLRDYIIVHELCHLRVLNHSQAFWDEVVAIMPDALVRAQTLRAFERQYGTAVSALTTLSQSHHDCISCSHAQLQNDRTTVFVPPESERSKCAVW